MKAPVNMTRAQERAWARLENIITAMNKCWDTDYLLTLYSKADDIRWKYFPAQANKEGDNWGVTKLYLKIKKELEEEKYVYINVHGNTVKWETA